MAEPTEQPHLSPEMSPAKSPERSPERSPEGSPSSQDFSSPEDFLLFSARNGLLRNVRDLLLQHNNGEITLDMNRIGSKKANRGWSALHLAAYFGHCDVVDLLAQAGADVNIVNRVGDTPLHQAAFTGRKVSQV
ncbi:oxysterol-binding protein-related protein 1-like [Liolophura sinensis]|uniref:oxysterol-binding protein-related protein 1-like n=1 Tax=Liolophura sinensis TaxID=3198878 RepID=UPI003158F869